MTTRSHDGETVRPRLRAAVFSRIIASLCAVLSFTLLMAWAPAWAELTLASPEVEIKKHSTGKEAFVRQGEKEWFIHIDVDQDRTMILRTESDKGHEINNQAEIIDRPMSNSEVDRLVGDFVSGIKSTLKP
ncbi:MAG TPA: hypothetical protein VGJ57_02570 [Nitrospirales bacterium]|jgi:hypothetical protein